MERGRPSQSNGSAARLEMTNLRFQIMQECYIELKRHQLYSASRQCKKMSPIQ